MIVLRVTKPINDAFQKTFHRHVLGEKNKTHLELVNVVNKANM